VEPASPDRCCGTHSPTIQLIPSLGASRIQCSVDWVGALRHGVSHAASQDPIPLPSSAVYVAVSPIGGAHRRRGRWRRLPRAPITHTRPSGPAGQRRAGETGSLGACHTHRRAPQDQRRLVGLLDSMAGAAPPLTCSLRPQTCGARAGSANAAGWLAAHSHALSVAGVTQQGAGHGGRDPPCVFHFISGAACSVICRRLTETPTSAVASRGLLSGAHRLVWSPRRRVAACARRHSSAHNAFLPLWKSGRERVWGAPASLSIFSTVRAAPLS